MPAATKPTVAVVFGGRSSEHSVSCATAAGVLAAIDRDHWNVIAIGITEQGQWVPASTDPQQWQFRDGYLPRVEPDAQTVLLPRNVTENTWRVLDADGHASVLADVDVVFPLLHGPFGEDGTIQGAFELVDVRYVGAGVLSSAISMDKAHMKLALRAAGLPVTPDVVLAPGESVNSRQTDIEALGLPVFVKPARAGSSMGITKVSALDALDAAVAAAVEHDPKVLIERAVEGREIETAVLEGADGLVASPAGEIVTGGDHEFYDYEAKYFDAAAVDLRCPTELPDHVAAKVKDYALRAFQAVGAESLARVDVFVGEDGTVTVNEINTMPGFTEFSMYPRMWAAAGVSYPELVQTLLAGALKRATGLR